MSLLRIKAILLQEFFITVRSVEVILDLFFWPSISMILFGFLANYLTHTSGAQVSNKILVGMLLWFQVFIVQYSVSVGTLWNVWSRSLSNLFITPLSVWEYLIALTISGMTKAVLIFILNSFVLFFFFHFNVLNLGVLNLILFFINLSFFSFSFGIFILGLIFRFGTRISAFAWGLLPIFQPLSATLFPVQVLPKILQSVAYLIPITYVFEAARFNVTNSLIQWSLIGISFFENIIYFVLAIWFFKLMLKKSKISGQFAKNEE